MVFKSGFVRALALSGLLIGAVEAQPEPAGFAELHQIDRAVASVAGETIRIVNRFGNVRIRSVPDQAEGSLRVTVQAHTKKTNPATVEVRRNECGPVFEVVADAESDDFIRADLVVALPDRAGVDVVLEDGDFTMHAASYPVRVGARSGQIRLQTSGRVDVEVLGGRVVYNPPGPVGHRPAGGRIQTSGAPVDVLVGDRTALNYRVVSGAAVTTDSLALLETRRREGRAVLFGDHQGANLLEIQTDHAPVRLVAEGHR
ncbi:MAG: hypothetical protein WD397_08455 [Wenzhouxiangellaceae bacterium]